MAAMSLPPAHGRASTTSTCPALKPDSFGRTVGNLRKALRGGARNAQPMVWRRWTSTATTKRKYRCPRRETAAETREHAARRPRANGRVLRASGAGGDIGDEGATPAGGSRVPLRSGDDGHSFDPRRRSLTERKDPNAVKQVDARRP